MEVYQIFHSWTLVIFDEYVTGQHSIGQWLHFLQDSFWTATFFILPLSCIYYITSHVIYDHCGKKITIHVMKFNDQWLQLKYDNNRIWNVCSIGIGYRWHVKFFVLLRWLCHRLGSDRCTDLFFMAVFWFRNFIYYDIVMNIFITSNEYTTSLVIYYSSWHILILTLLCIFQHFYGSINFYSLI